MAAPLSVRRNALALLRLLGSALLGGLLRFLCHWLIPPFRLGFCCGRFKPRHRDASAAWHSARACRLLPASFTRDRSLARDICPWAKGSREKVGQCLEATAPLQSGLSYFFFAFLAFLAAFFAFLAIVPPEGVRLCLMATTDEVH